MDNTKEIKRRILSIESVIKTTEAMKMISVVKLKKSKNKLIQAKIYLDYIKSFFLDFEKDFLIKKKYFFSSIGKKLFIIFTSNRGLCGSFNSLIFEKINQILKKEKDPNKCIFFSIGKKGFSFLSKKYNMYEINNSIYDYMNIFSYEERINFVKQLIKDFFKKNFSSIYLVYNSLKNSLFQEIIVEKFLPIVIKDLKNTKISFSILEPSKEIILEYIILKFLNAKLLKIFLESIASEHTARMISMHKATENAFDIKNNLMLNYNKERQTNITKEILEIIGGLESINNEK
ncbi:ATP synthase F1 subunit gamma [Blattabacterium cuenoti]|uniref:ATP synthase F1 subunit gamma n=1 Tax=Blattabacterium cuenoti TaxID=1653831 RepID=UPI00163C9AAE|nr:ATP synthase F1 subunit gamma [Blattabacterium cuenoti]